MCARYRGKKSIHLGGCFHLNGFSLPCSGGALGKNSYCLIYVSPVCYTVQGHIYCFKVSFLQMVIGESKHTVLMKQRTSDGCIG